MRRARDGARRAKAGADGKTGADDPIARALQEKYYHSRAAALTHSGELDRAIRYARKAVALDDRSYTRSDLAALYVAKGELHHAWREVSRAIALDPSSRRAFELRSEISRAMGKHEAADDDRRAAARLDPDISRLPSLRRASTALQKAFDPGRSAEWVEQPVAGDAAVAAAVGDHIARLAAGEEAVSGRSCVVPCPAYCCHFEHAPVVHGVCIGAWKLRAVRQLLREKGVREDRFLTRFAPGMRRSIRQVIPLHFLLRERGEEVVFSPATGGRRLGKTLAGDRPRGRDCEELVWITADSRACVFLEEGRCAIHDAGGDPALPACKEFQCLTGFVFLVLSHLGFTSPDRLRGRAMGDLNRVAADALVILHDRIYGYAPLESLAAAMAEALRGALAAEGQGDGGDAAARVARYRELERDYDRLLSQQRKKARRDLFLLESSLFCR